MDWGYRFGIRADVAFAQMMHETNSLRYGGDVQPWQNNFAGIGATGGGNPGNSFATAELGVIAHYAHLAWYIFPYHVNGYCNSNYDPRHFGSSHKNTVRTIRDLGGQWAVPGTGYGDAIARYATAIWSYNARGHLLGSFNEVPGFSSAQLSNTWYFTWYDSLPQNGMAGNWIVISNQGAGTARVRIQIGETVIHDPSNPENEFLSIPEGGRITPMIPNFMAGPCGSSHLTASRYLPVSGSCTGTRSPRSPASPPNGFQPRGNSPGTIPCRKTGWAATGSWWRTWARRPPSCRCTSAPTLRRRTPKRRATPCLREPS